MRTLLFTIFVLTSGLVFAGDTKDIIAVHVANLQTDRPAGLEADYYTCLGDGWENDFRKVHNRIKTFKNNYPGELKDLGERQKNCFASEEVSSAAQEDLDVILNLIDKSAGNHLYASAPETKSFSLKMRDLDLKLSEDFEQPLKNQHTSFGKKFGRASLLVGGAYLGSMGLMVPLPLEVTGWEEGWTSRIPQNYKRAWTTMPVKDQDHWSVNYLIHPYAGAYYYNALRSQGASRITSLAFSALASTAFEYGVEASAEIPSRQDLWATWVIGGALGELGHMATMKMRKNGFSTTEKIIVTIINPAYVMNNGYKVKRK